jgi:hypothetical protein
MAPLTLHAVADGCAGPDAKPAAGPAPFEALCNGGGALTARNWATKLQRYSLMPSKQLYLPFMFSGLPTNYLMVGGFGGGGGG